MEYSNYFSSISEDMHLDINEELLFLRQATVGDIKAIEKNIKDRMFRKTIRTGTLSKDPLTNIKYHMVITAALLSRFCIANGMAPEAAFKMSDFYIQKLDNARTEDKVEEIHDNMILDYTKRMNSNLRNEQLSSHVIKAKNYIYAHLSERITIKKLAEYVGISTSLLSKKFSQETGQSMSDFIRDKKIEMAKDLLINTNMSILEVAYHFSFSSQSHFIQAFKKSTGFTPKQYRSKNKATNSQSL